MVNGMVKLVARPENQEKPLLRGTQNKIRSMEKHKQPLS
jgi:hypothetical protein